MKFKGRPVQPSRVDLPMLQTWLEKLLELPSPPTVEECSQGAVLLAALHHISSTQPLVSTSYADMLIIREPKSATFGRLNEALAAAGLEEQTRLLEDVSKGNAEALERLLLGMYQNYAVNHAHKFRRQPDAGTPREQEFLAPPSRSSPGHRQHPREHSDEMLSQRTPVEGSSEDVMMASGAFSDHGCHGEVDEAVPPQEEVFEDGNHAEEQQTASQEVIPGHNTPAAPALEVASGSDSESSPSAFLVASLMAQTPRHQQQHPRGRHPQADRSSREGGSALEPDSEEEEPLLGDLLAPTPHDWVPASQRCLVAWLGGVTGRKDPVGRMLLGSSSMAVKATMLSNAAAHRSAAAQIFGLPHPGSHATAPAEQNASATLHALEQVSGSAVSDSLRAACTPGNGARGLNPASQLALGAAVAQASVARLQQGERPSSSLPPGTDDNTAARELLDWADGLLLQGLPEPLSASLPSVLYYLDGTVAWERLTFGAICRVIAAAGGAGDEQLLPWEAVLDPGSGPENDSWQPHADRLCSRLGSALPFQPGDLPAGPQSCPCLRALLLAFLADLRPRCCSDRNNVGGSSVSAAFNNSSSSKGGTSVVVDTTASSQQRMSPLRPSSASPNLPTSSTRQQQRKPRPQTAAPHGGSSRPSHQQSSSTSPAPAAASSQHSHPPEEHLTTAPQNTLPQQRASGAERPRSSRGQSRGSSQTLQPVGLLPAADRPRRMSSSNGCTAEVLTVDSGDKAEEELQHEEQLGAFPGPRDGPAPGVSSSMAVSGDMSEQRGRRRWHHPPRPSSASATPLEPLVRCQEEEEQQQRQRLGRFPEEQVEKEDNGECFGVPDSAEGQEPAVEESLAGLWAGPVRGISSSVAAGGIPSEQRGRRRWHDPQRPSSASATPLASLMQHQHQPQQKWEEEMVAEEEEEEEEDREQQQQEVQQREQEPASEGQLQALSRLLGGPVKGVSASMAAEAGCPLLQKQQGEDGGGRRRLHYGARPSSASETPLVPLSAQQPAPELRESLVPANMFATPTRLRSSTSRPPSALLGQAAHRAPQSRGGTGNARSSSARSSFLQPDVFAPPEQPPEGPPSSPDSPPPIEEATTPAALADGTPEMLLLDKVEGSGGIGRFRSRGSAVSSSFAGAPGNWAPCPELSASTPHLSLAAAAPPGFSSLPLGFNLGMKEEEEVAVPVARLQGMAEDSQEEATEEQDTAEEAAAEEMGYSLEEEQGTGPRESTSADPWASRSSAVRSSGASQRNASNQQLETGEKSRPFMEPPHLQRQQQQQQPAGEAIGDSGAVASWLVKKIQMREQQQQHLVQEGEGPDGGLELTLGAMGSRREGVPEVHAAAAQWGNEGERLGALPPGRLVKGSAREENLFRSQEEEALEASLRPYTGCTQEDEQQQLQLEDAEARYRGEGAVSVEAFEPQHGSVADHLEEAEWPLRAPAQPAPLQDEYYSEEPEEPSGGAGLYGTPSPGPGGSRIPRWSPPSNEEQHQREQAAARMQPGAAPLVPPSPGILSGGGFFPAPRDAAPAAPPVVTGVAFDVAAGDTAGGDDDDPQRAEAERERAAKVQAMLDAKRERFLLERKAKEQAAQERAAKEDRQRRALAKQRIAEVEARKQQQRSPAVEAADLVTATTPDKLSRPRQEVLAEASLPLEEHLALLVASSGNPEGEEGADAPPLGSPGAAPPPKPQAHAPAHAPARRAPAAANPPPPSFSRASNRKLIRNALCHVCLAGAARAKEKEAVLEALDGYKGDDSFIVLFKNSTMPLHFRGLYVHERQGGRVTRLYGKGPDEIEPSAVATFFKYDSGSRDFKAMQTSGFTFGMTAAMARV